MALGDSEFDVLVVDDGSPDGTPGAVRALQQEFPGRIKLHERPGKLGLGTAYIEGFKICLADPAGYRYIFEMDADFSHDPKDLLRLLSACRDEGADMAVGSRYVTGVNVVNWPIGRVLMSYYASAYVRLVTGMPVHDTTAGFACYTRRVLEALPLDSIRCKGYAFQIEMKFQTFKRVPHQGGAHRVCQSCARHEQDVDRYFQRGCVRCAAPAPRQHVQKISAIWIADRY